MGPTWIKKRRIKQTKKETNGCREREVRVFKFFFSFLLLVYFSDLRKFDRRISSG